MRIHDLAKASSSRVVKLVLLGGLLFYPTGCAEKFGAEGGVDSGVRRGELACEPVSDGDSNGRIC